MFRAMPLFVSMFVAVFVGTMLGISPAPAQTGSKAAFCDNYARIAVGQNNQNIQRRCGYSGGQGGAGWGSVYQPHYAWCMRVSGATANQHTNIRNAMLRRCAAPTQRMFRSRWDKIGGPGGGWTTGWVPNHPQQVCGHGAQGCSCFGRNYCGTYRSGQSTYWWPQGCNGPRWVIRCTSVPQ